MFKDSTLGLLDKNALKSFLDKLEQHAKATQDEHKVRYPQAMTSQNNIIHMPLALGPWPSFVLTMVKCPRQEEAHSSRVFLD